MKITGELIERFLAGQCSPEETAFILDALQANPELLDEYIGKHQWDEIHKAPVDMPEELKQRIHTNVLKATIKKKTAAIYRMRRGWMAAAACIAAAFVVGWFLYQESAAGNRQSADENRQSVPPTDGSNRQLAALPVDTVVSNEGKARMRIALADGSVVLLSSHSVLHYQPVFAGQKREIWLQGEGYFEVAKDKHKPFIVYSNGISTTALGTSFTIRAFDDSHLVKVNLYTGKVVVKKINRQAANDTAVYLIPGDQLTINTITYHTELIKEPSSLEKQRHLPTPYPAMKELVFDREPLSRVFEQLEQRFKTSLTYDEQSLTTLSFTGTILPKDSLEKVLDRIAFLNDLTITKTSRGYNIRIK